MSRVSRWLCGLSLISAALPVFICAGSEAEVTKYGGSHEGEEQEAEAARDQTNITAKPGQNIFLPCRSPDNKPVIVVEWIRPDLGSEYVLLYRDDQVDLENQHVMFRDRVDLEDRQMKDGNVSLVLRNVTPEDRGEYECQVIQAETNGWKKTVIIINLDVKTPSGDPGGGNGDGSVDLIGLVVGVSVGLLVGLLALVILVYLSCKKASCWSP